ncbi:hypothetical protein HMPREF9332_01824 [Alloprevotella rava F0323]|uniref:Uncharacterized protein n=1 Tax=Alloprevotella rava F0323 TaxID=679199 RepID=G5GE22_9BACT|nr:hypothetical protein [Alloprevotella rava]EHG21195.1 hypothetical protein HMPREF9332_01824 [Alloprevotella rava F0323]
MNKGQIAKLSYTKPESYVLHIGTEMQPLCGSFQGGHNGSTSGGDLGDSGNNGHNSGESGGSMGDTRREWNQSSSFSLWD